MIDLQNRKFERLTVLHRLPNHLTKGGNIVVMWACLCLCGNKTKASSGSLRSGKIKSCGCLSSEIRVATGKTNRTHGGYSQDATPDERIKQQALANIKERSRRRGYESDLETTDLPQLTTHCPVLGIRYEKGSLANKDSVPSIDRKNTNLPYLKKYKDNLRFISHRANRIKSDATAEELCKVLEYVSNQDVKQGDLND